MPFSQKKQSWLKPLLITLLVTLSGAACFLINPSFLHRIELDTIDLRFRFRGETPPHPDIVLAVIDEKSIACEGKWPWPRSKIARMIDRLSDSGARVIAFDIGFLEPDQSDQLIRPLLETVYQKHPSLFTEAVHFNRFLEKVTAEVGQDHLLAEAIQNARAEIVLGHFFYMSDEEKNNASKASEDERYQHILNSQYQIKNLPPKPLLPPLLTGVSPQSNIGIISRAARHSGYFNMVPADDGTVRKIPMVIQCRDNLFAPLSLNTAGAYLKAPLSITVDAYGVKRIRVGTISVPTDNQGRMAINYRGGAKTFPHFSITDIISGNIPAERFKDKIVIAGATAIGIYDMRLTPFETVFPGVEIHANGVDNILTQEFIHQPDWMVLVNLVIILTLGCLMGLVLPRLGTFRGTLVVLTSCFSYLLLAQYLFAGKGYIINIIYPLGVILLMYVSITLYRFLIESRQKQFIKTAFSHYLSPTVINSIINAPETLTLGGSKRHITAFFSDLQGFTSISESLMPENLVKLLNEFLTEMTDIILKYEGTVDKFEGDAIIAFFGAPCDLDNHALAACRAGIDMQKRLNDPELRKRWKNQYGVDLKMRIGLSTGDAVVGNMGSNSRMDYTMMGDTVNTAARLEGVNKFYNSFFMIGEETQKKAGDAIVTREIDLIYVIGKRKPIRIFQVIGYPEDVGASTWHLLDAYAKGLHAYRTQEWAVAIACFEKALAVFPDDGPSRTLFERAIAYQKAPPQGMWDGVYQATQK